ncbi:MAG: prolyl oligopeptidase family serine peptidase [Candidatus Cloacimonetes bacterium]|nr:prolyl oligopeptidase family serine peptidase [Candidatus Cloacimonadota bacterium]
MKIVWSICALMIVLLIGAEMNEIYSETEPVQDKLIKTGYKQPSGRILDIFNSPTLPYMSFRHFSPLALEITQKSHQSLEQLAEPTLNLGGLKISPRINANLTDYPAKEINVVDVLRKSKIAVDFNEDIKIRSLKTSHDNKKTAFSFESDDGIYLGIIDMLTGKVKKFDNFRLNEAFDNDSFYWMNDGRHITALVIPQKRTEAPQKNQIPDSPLMEESVGVVSQLRTYQNLLSNKHEELLFEHYTTSIITVIDTRNGNMKKISQPGIYNSIAYSPDYNYLLVSEISKPFSYSVPYYYFPKVFKIIDKRGNLVKEFYKRPLQDNIPIGGTYTGPRYMHWNPQKNAELVYVEALDNGDPKNIVPFRDKFMIINSPFNEEAQELFKTEHRFSSVYFSEISGEMIFYEYDRDKLWYKGWLFNRNNNQKELFEDISAKDAYNKRGQLLHRTMDNGHSLFVRNGDLIYYINNSGASPEGSFPYFASYNTKTSEQIKLFQSRNEHYEAISAVPDDFKHLIIRSETPYSPRNYQMINLQTQERTPLSNYQNPHPEISSLKKELIKYSRNDGVELSGTLYLPAEYKEGTRLPLIINAYPEEYADAGTAGQVKSSPYRFISFWGHTAKYLVFEDYAVLEGASIPIVGDPETVNETFIEQLLKSVESAIDYLDSRGIIDRDKVGIIGHSYGAFMVANVLAHSELCKTGIAKSGAYNRTLTPFGFQKERRTLWEAKEFYIDISPFMFADKINEPILLIHGQNDSNSGTYTIQSERMYQAIKGNGGTSRLVILPLEDHNYRAKESNLHVLSEMIEWFNKYLKGN